MPIVKLKFAQPKDFHKTHEISVVDFVINEELFLSHLCGVHDNHHLTFRFLRDKVSIKY